MADSELLSSSVVFCSPVSSGTIIVPTVGGCLRHSTDLVEKLSVHVRNFKSCDITAAFVHSPHLESGSKDIEQRRAYGKSLPTVQCCFIYEHDSVL